MIPSRLITAWSRFAPWLTDEQVEQDLVLSRLIVELANHPVLGEELVFRGGTCLHKVVLPTPLRYSEDLDYVRATHGGHCRGDNDDRADRLLRRPACNARRARRCAEAGDGSQAVQALASHLAR